MTTRSNQESAVRFVVIEDDKNDRDLLARQLQKSSLAYHVMFLPDGKAGLNFLSNLPLATAGCDLIAIFLDLRLPGMGGVDLLREIRKMPLVENTPVIIMTSSLDPRDYEACQTLKVSAFIPKPVTFYLFSKAIMCLPHFAASRSGKLMMSHLE